MSKLVLRATVLGLFVLVGSPTWARQGPPANDNFANALALSGNSLTATGNNTGATAETGEPAHFGDPTRNAVWWTWTAPVGGGSVTIDTIGSAFDTILAVYTGTAVNSLTEVAADDDGGGGGVGGPSKVTFTATAGITYRIAVDGYGADAGPVILHLNNFVAVYALQENFNVAAGWTFSAPVNGSAWAIDSTPAGFPGGVSRTGMSLNFNNGTDYAGGGAGGTISPAIVVTGLQNPILQFWCNYNTETRGTQSDRRTLQIYNSNFGKLAEWQLASVGYSFNAAGGLTGVGPGPCSEAYVDLETGTPVTAWHKHRVHLDPFWGTIFVRFVFWSVDDQRNNYAGWAIDDLEVRNHPTAAPTGWPDNTPDTHGSFGIELEDCQREAGNMLRWSWGCTNLGSANVHMIIGDHPQSTLHQSFMFFDTGHGHYHLSQYSDFSLWKMVAGNFQKLRRGAKRSFCLMDINAVNAGPPQSISPGCSGVFQAISYGWQDVYARGTTGQEIDVNGLATATDYYLVGVIDPLNRLRETNNLNNTDTLHFTLAATTGQVAFVAPSHSNPYPPTASGLTVTSVTQGTGPSGNAGLHIFGTGFDTTLVPVVYDVNTMVAEAPYFTIVSATEIWVDLPTVGGFGAPASFDLLRPDGSNASFRLGGAVPAAIPAPADPTPLGGGGGSGGGGGGGGCGATGLEAAVLAALAALLRRRRR